MLVGNWHVIYSYGVQADLQAPDIVLPEAINLLDFGAVAAGDSRTIPIAVRNQGTAPLTVVDASTSHPSFTIEPRQMRIAPGGTATVEVRYAGTGGHESAIVTLESDDPAEPVRSGFLTANQPGLGVGKPLPEVTVNLVDGGEWSSTDSEGEVMLLAYFATF
jgi:hypothetical protein